MRRRVIVVLLSCAWALASVAAAVLWRPLPVALLSGAVACALVGLLLLWAELRTIAEERRGQRATIRRSE